MKPTFELLAIVVGSMAIAAANGLPSEGFRVVKGGASPDGRYLICVLSSDGTEFTDQLKDEDHAPYLVDLDAMSIVQRIDEVSTLGGLWGKPETNVHVQWFPDSKRCGIGWRTGRLNHTFQVFRLDDSSGLVADELPCPFTHPDSLFENLGVGSNAGSFVETICSTGEVIVVYYGFLPNTEEFWNTPEGKVFDFNRIEVIYRLRNSEWSIATISSPGKDGEPGLGENNR